MTIKEGPDIRKWGVVLMCCPAAGSGSPQHATTRHRDIVLQPVASTAANREPRHAGLRVGRASGRQRLQWEWGSSHWPRDQPGILVSSENGGAHSGPEVSQVSSRALGGEERLPPGSREAAWPWPHDFFIGWWGSGEMPLVLAALGTYKGHAPDFVLGEVNMKALHWLHVWGHSQTAHEEI